MAFCARNHQPGRRNRRARQRVSAVVLATALLTSGACASIRHPRPQTVWVHSRPSGADVFVGEQHAGVTPVAFVPNRRARKTVLRLEKNGFAPVKLPLRRSLSRSLLGDLVFPGAVTAAAAQEARGAELAHVFAGTLAFTLGIDFLTGAAFRFPGSVRATLERSPGNSRERTATAVGPRRDGGGATPAPSMRKRNRLLPARLIGKTTFTEREKR